jgi:myo-inositol-1(or 4)-monophosphatase
MPATDLLAIAHELADLAARKTTRMFRTRLHVNDKSRGGLGGGAFDPVTQADRAAEQAMRRHLARRCPDHGVIGEEFAKRDGAGLYNWVLDPIDGTRAYMTGLPLWGTLIGLIDGPTPVLGMMDQPFTRERFWASRSGPALWRQGDAPARRLKTRRCPDIGHAMLMATTPDMFRQPAKKRAFRRVSAAVRMTRFGGDCYAYCMLAAGHVDVIVEAGLKTVDIVPLIPIIERAGGRVTSWTGGSAMDGGDVVATGDAALHDEVLSLLRG